MPVTVGVSGSFTCNGRPVRGWVRFTPERLWVMEDGIAWACLTAMVQLDHDGQFSVLLTPTDSDPVPWHYQVDTPAGAWRVQIHKSQPEYGLKELLDEHHPGPRPPHGR